MAYLPGSWVLDFPWDSEMHLLLCFLGSCLNSVLAPDLGNLNQAPAGPAQDCPFLVHMGDYWVQCGEEKMKLCVRETNPTCREYGDS